MTDNKLSDRNFDGLIQQFNQRIYHTSKGRIRLTVLQRDLEEAIPNLFTGNTPLRILDAGSGEGILALKLAQVGHRVTLFDYSADMLTLARAGAEKLDVMGNVEFIHGRIQEQLPNGKQYDLVLCHAVLEWVAQPRALAQVLLDCLKPNGLISLMFFNYHSTVFRSLVRGYLEKALQNRFAGSGKGLTPINPLQPDQVVGWFEQWDMDILVQSGIRVFHDYMHRDVRDRRAESDILELELRYSRQEPYRALGRYYHLVGRRR